MNINIETTEKRRGRPAKAFTWPDKKMFTTKDVIETNPSVPAATLRTKVIQAVEQEQLTQHGTEKLAGRGRPRTFYSLSSLQAA